MSFPPKKYQSKNTQIHTTDTNPHLNMNSILASETVNHKVPICPLYICNKKE